MKMAKRYIRINWQNKPSVATPISATNLNKMDKGIDDCDNAIEEIYNKRVNNVVTTNPDTFLAGPVGKTLQDQITTLNNKLAVQTGVFNYNPGFSKANNDAQVIKTGKVVTLCLGVKKTDDTAFAPGASLVIGMIPEGFRPKVSQICVVGMHSAEWGISSVGYGYVSTNGGVSIINFVEGMKVANIQITYLTA